jgi:hypothetical protein
LGILGKNMDIDLSSSIFLVTVGVNSSHGAIRSPIFRDGTFELMPKPEERSLWAPTLPAYPKMASFNNSGEPLSNYVSSRYRNVRVMDDPEFQSFTYGAYVENSQYQRKLMRCKPGDYIVFLSLLTHYDEKFIPHHRGYYIVGFMYVEKTLFFPNKFPDREDFANFGKNAYIRRAVYHPKTLEGVCLWKGDPAMSIRLKHAVLFKIESILKQKKQHYDQGTKFPRDDVSKIGGYLRYVQVPFDKGDDPEVFEKKIEWWNEIKNGNPNLSL